MDLTNLASVKQWLKVTSTDDDVLLGRLVSQLSGAALNYLERPSIARKTCTELRSGVDNQQLTLRNWPVVQIGSLQVDGVTIPAATTATANGYTLETWDGTGAGVPQQLTLRGYRFCRGLNNISIVYDAGYCVLSQPQTVPVSPYQVTVQPAGGSWAQDDGVTYANGTALTAVPNNTTPATGQYTVTAGNTGEATYTFAAGDAGQNVLISYSFTPFALEQAVMEWIGERYRYKDRIGQASKSLGGNETASYSLKAIPDYISVVFDGYKKFLPL
jgi:hypothetical protein